MYVSKNKYQQFIDWILDHIIRKPLYFPMALAEGNVNSIIGMLLSQLNQHKSSRLVIDMALNVRCDICHHVIDKYSRVNLQPSSQVKLTSANPLRPKHVDIYNR